MIMLEKLQQLEQRYSLVQARLNEPETYNDTALVTKLNQEQRELEELVTTYREYQKCQTAMEEAELMMEEEDAELRELAKEEYFTAKDRSAELEKNLQILLLPKDPNDEKNVIVGSVPVSAGKKRRSLPTLSIECMGCTAISEAGNRKSQVPI